MAVPASETRRPEVGPLVLAASLPLILLHKRYQPVVGLGALDLTASDVAIAAVLIAAAHSGWRHGVRPLVATRAVWITLTAFLLWLAASLVWARRFDSSYALGSHVVSAGKFVEYALLAPAVPLLLRTTVSVRVLFRVLLAWSSFLTLIAALQFLGLVDEFEGRRPLQREPSYIGIHELGAVSGIVLVTAFVTLLAGRWRRSSAWAATAGGLGVALAAALDSIGGIAAAAVSIWLIERSRGRVPARRTVALAVLVVCVAGAAVALRGSAVTAFLQFVGVRKQEQSTRTHVQSYAHRTLLGYIGLRIWLDHPVVGVGWQESREPAAFRPQLRRAHARFPDEPAAAFPSPEHPWGVQNGVIQTLADLGLVGLVLLLSTLLFAAATAVGAARAGVEAGSAAIGWLWVGFAVFTGIGLLAGTPIDAVLWLAVGLATAPVARDPRLWHR